MKFELFCLCDITTVFPLSLSFGNKKMKVNLYWFCCILFEFPTTQTEVLEHFNFQIKDFQNLVCSEEFATTQLL